MEIKVWLIRATSHGNELRRSRFEVLFEPGNEGVLVGEFVLVPGIHSMAAITDSDQIAGDSDVTERLLEDNGLLVVDEFVDRSVEKQEGRQTLSHMIEW